MRKYSATVRDDIVQGVKMRHDGESKYENIMECSEVFSPQNKLGWNRVLQAE